MDPSSSSATTLARPRFALAIISAVAALTVGIYLLHTAASASPAAGSGPGGLHRSNAVRRRSRQRTSRRSRRGSTGSRASVSSAEHGDENRPDENHNQHDRRDANAEAGSLLGEPRGFQNQPDGETMAEDLGGEWWEDSQPPNQPRSGQNIVSLLFRVSEDNARRNAYVHRGCACNACGIVPIRGVRYRCANCADFDLCETCESQGMHIKTHIFYKVKIPAPPFGPRQMQPVVYPGDPDTCIRNLPHPLMVRLSRETGFERPELEAFWEQWTFIANTEWREDPDDLGLAMDRRTFERCLVPSGGYRHAAPNLIHDRMFAFYDTNNDDLIGFSEFLHGLAYRKRPDKLRRIFEGYDVDRDGYVDRRDFLRLFRAYYVLFKQMHKYILEGLDDQVMSSTEAHQLVTSRQPLSSLFGREGRVPDADHDRAQEGKVFHGNGDVALAGSSEGAVNEDKPDTSGREEILTSLFNRGSPQPFFAEPLFSPDTAGPQSPRGGDAGPRYFDGLLNPPRSTAELSAVLDDRPRNTLDSFLHYLEEREREGPETNRGQESDPWAHNPAGDDPSDPSRHLDEDFGNMPYHSDPKMYDGTHRLRVTKKSRLQARRKLLERWRRRQFYLDEEEGASAPQGWSAKEDVFADPAEAEANHNSKINKGKPDAMSQRSRSSSKVRFAEETDDYEIRSNPSTSSRSVPERWGGMEIPDAERDAGKEILYQVTQQAFNELLDVLFKKKEDLAVRAASTREDRRRYRKYFESINPDEEDGRKQQHQDHPNSSSAAQKENREENTSAPVQQARQAQQTQTVPSSDTTGHVQADATPQEETVLVDGDAAHSDAASIYEEPANYEQDGGVAPEAQQSEGNQTETRPHDPTMPQFRPNSDADLARSAGALEAAALGASNAGAESDCSGESTSAEDIESTGRREESDDDSNGDDDDDAANVGMFPRYMLVEWKRLDLAEQEQRQRGGWGKLSYAEFEEIYRREERHSNRLDYLGSWIDVCIPYS
ncbi:EF hand domain-containing protein [Magnaporthiopsis poae ATCC 64411]|uniref:EF hand domain-containing protein n=1 Tax=Magnaporthiopsis poae (strain ATCC 64411 / 73-15) TaxID=644358 RepID=A0A0C4E4V5_MAGP6|nr:EF hand domain-containing protein [Magnaporthiopsis poae ATCC 64411]